MGRFHQAEVDHQAAVLKITAMTEESTKLRQENEKLRQESKTLHESQNKLVSDTNKLREDQMQKHLRIVKLEQELDRLRQKLSEAQLNIREEEEVAVILERSASKDKAPFSAVNAGVVRKREPADEGRMFQVSRVSDGNFVRRPLNIVLNGQVPPSGFKREMT